MSGRTARAMALLSMVAFSCAAPFKRAPASVRLTTEQRLARNPGDAEALIQLGRRYREEGNLEEAFILLQKAVAADGRRAEARYELGLVYFQRGLIGKEIREYQRALAIDPQYLPARENLAHALVASGDLEGAELEYRRLLTAAPGNLPALFNLAILCADYLRFDEARQLLEAYLARETDPAWAERARALLQEVTQKQAEGATPSEPMGVTPPQEGPR